MDKVSVVIRNKNQAEALAFLFKNLNERYSDAISEIIVLDNLSTDTSLEVSKQYSAKVVSIQNFGYGSSANLAAESASNEIVVIFSAHAYPVSHDFFKLITKAFKDNKNLAGVRCLHNKNDYKTYINRVSAKENPQASGVIFCGSAFNKNVWLKHKFKADIKTMEDKEWSLRVLEAGFDIEFVPAIFCYDIHRNRKQLFFRFKNEVVGGYQLWHTPYSFAFALKAFIGSIYKIVGDFIADIFYAFKRFIYMIRFLFNKPEKF